MKKIVFIFTLAFLFSCDKVENPYEAAIPDGFDENLFPGDFSTYPWPTFEANTNTNLNVLLEDYTGHTCVFCPAAADIAAQIETANTGRVFVASIHASPGGLGDFQKLEPPTFVHDFTNPAALDYGKKFENGFGFNGNPRGTLNRKVMDGFMFQGAINWQNNTSILLTDNDLKADLQAHSNYFPETRGYFLHTEFDTMSLDASNLSAVIYFIEESFIAPQKKPGVTDYEYHHHNVLRGTLDGLSFGRNLTKIPKNNSGKYQLDLTYKIPSQYDPANCHVLIYLMDATTYEVYQVIKQSIL